PAGPADVSQERRECVALISVFKGMRQRGKAVARARAGFLPQAWERMDSGSTTPLKANYLAPAASQRARSSSVISDMSVGSVIRMWLPKGSRNAQSIP